MAFASGATIRSSSNRWTNTDTADVMSTVNQTMALANAGSELVRVTVNNDEAARAVPKIVETLYKFGVRVPIVGDFHYNGHLLLRKYPDCARALAKYRINPGNVNIGKKHDDNYRTMIEAGGGIRPSRAHRRQLGLARPGPADAHDGRETPACPSRSTPKPSPWKRSSSARSNLPARAEQYGLTRDKIILSAKVSGVQDLISVYRALAARLRLRTAPRAHRSRPRLEGNRGHHRGAFCAATGRHRRHDSRLAHFRSPTAIAPRK